MFSETTQSLLIQFDRLQVWPMDTLQDITRRLQILRELLADLPVDLAYLHGSMACQQATAFSDVDVALVASRDLSPLEQLNLELDLESALARRGIPNADARVINRAPLEAQGRVVSRGVLVYSRAESVRSAFENRVLARYRSLLPALDQQWLSYVNRARAELQSKGFYAA